MGYYGFGTLVPLVLASKGYSIVTSLTFTSLTAAALWIVMLDIAFFAPSTTGRSLEEANVTNT